MDAVMKAHPIPFRAPMIRALLNGSKSQTRRIIKGKEIFISASGAVMDMADGHIKEIKFPYGEQGGYLWVREPWRVPSSLNDLSGKQIADKAIEAGYRLPWCPIKYEADDVLNSLKDWNDFGSVPKSAIPGRYRHARFMPRWASRITLKMIGLKVEKLQSINKKDAFAEGVTKRNGLYCMDWSPVGNPHPLGGVIAESYIANDNPVGAFATYFEKLRGSAVWDLNPWVWAIEFEVINQNVDEVLNRNQNLGRTQ